MRVFRGLDVAGDEAINRTAELTGLTPDQVAVAIRYYAEYTDEIDAWIHRIDADAARIEAAWRRQQALLRR
jgi:hypothetical protein